MRITAFPLATRAKSLSGWREAALLLLAWAWAGVSFGMPSAPVRAGIRLHAAGREFPVVWSGETLEASANFSSVSFFNPLFDPRRAAVNPSRPKRVGRRRIRFDRSGEYYLVLDRNAFSKVLVLSREEPISSNVLRIFDFFVANSLFSPWEGNDDAEFFRDQVAYAERFFRREGGMVLSCGPTHSVLGRVVQDVLALPTRRPTFPGAFRWEGSIYFDTHNPIEIYLPDKSKWVLFDVNYAFVARWLGAQELCAFVRKHASPNDTGYAGAYAFRELDVHDAPKVFLAIEDPSSAGGKRISSIPVAYAWRDEFRYFYSGVAYWGEMATWQMPTGTEFLSGEYVWASLHTSKDLELAAREWIESFGIHVTIVSPTTLDQLLQAGHERLIASAPWRKKREPFAGPTTLGKAGQAGAPRSIRERAEK